MEDDMGANLVTEAIVATAAACPGVGRRYLASFPEVRFELQFESPSSLSWIRLHDDGSRGPFETEVIATTRICERIVLVSWQEANRTTVVCLQDFGKGLVHTHITRSDGSFLRASGTLVEVGQSRPDPLPEDRFEAL
jgi:hypothetical protein